MTHDELQLELKSQNLNDAKFNIFSYVSRLTSMVSPETYQIVFHNVLYKYIYDNLGILEDSR